jgi:YfiH family protein
VTAGTRPAPAAGVEVVPVTLPGTPARGWFTGRPDDTATTPPVGMAGNLSHHRPHLPARLAADRRDALARMGLAPDDTVWMRQVHGGSVAVVDADTPPAAELPEVDALVTAEPGRALVVQVADCVPVLLAGADGVVAAVHAGRRGVMAGVVPAALATMAELGAAPDTVRAVLGPAIGGCCYEVPAELRARVAADHPAAAATTTWGTPSLDLPAAVAALLEDHGVAAIERVDACTHHDRGRWFSHRRDPSSGRQIGVVVHDGTPT